MIIKDTQYVLWALICSMHSLGKTVTVSQMHPPWTQHPLQSELLDIAVAMTDTSTTFITVYTTPLGLQGGNERSMKMICLCTAFKIFCVKLNNEI